MSSAISPRPAFTPAELAELRALDLPDTDGMPMDSDWQRTLMNLLIELARYYLRRQKKGYVSGDMCFYYSLTQALNRDFLGPDFFYVKDAARHPRGKWEVWNESNQFPNVIIELLSPSTKDKDLGEKKLIYEQTFQTREYFAYDTEDETLSGWRLSPLTGCYEAIERDDEGRLHCEELGLWLGTWYGTVQGDKRNWLRFFHADGSLVLRHAEELRQRELRQRSLTFKERKEKDEERRLKDDERQKKEDALKLAASEREAKEAALAEVERLRKLLESK